MDSIQIGRASQGGGKESPKGGQVSWNLARKAIHCRDPDNGFHGGTYGRIRGGHPGSNDGQIPREPGEVIPAPWRASRQQGTVFDGNPASTMGRLRP